MNPRIKLNDLKKSFNDQVVLNGIDLTVHSGEIVGLIGPSGAGKSTVIKTMLGMEKADSGEAFVLDKHMPNREILGSIGYMAQSDALYETLTARENLFFFGQMKGIASDTLTEQIKASAKIVDLTEHLDKRVKFYSGGMKRRLSLAISLLGTPPLLILDEPTVGIDPSLRQKIWRDLNNLNNKGDSILVTTHVMDEAELVDRVALLIDGKIIAFDTPTNLKKQYQVDSIEQVFLIAEDKR